MDIEKMNKILSYEKLLNLCKNKKFLFRDQDILNIAFQGNINLIDNEWNCFSLDKNFVINAPVKFYKNYENAFKNPSIVHYTKKNLPTLNSHTSLDIYFWKYARKSIFYEEILKDICFRKNTTKKNDKLKNRIVKIFKNHPNILMLLGSLYYFFRKK